MAEELGRIERPSAEAYRGKRKLFLLPLVQAPQLEAKEGLDILEKYWQQAQSQIASLEAKLGGLRHIYHESLTEGGEDGLKFLEQAELPSKNFVRLKCQAGATLEPTEDQGLVAETLDLQRCLMMPFASDSVARRLHEWFTESTRQRYEHIAKQIDSTLQDDESGLLLISERHQVQFPPDVEVFYVAPPALDEFRRWLQNWMAKQQAQAQPDEEPEAEESGE